jgi:hypothetical protein
VDATAIYYTLSTIAQTLAGALAVLVAFVLFRLSHLSELVRHAGRSWQPSTPLWTECGRY